MGDIFNMSLYIVCTDEDDCRPIGVFSQEHNAVSKIKQCFEDWKVEWDEEDEHTWNYGSHQIWIEKITVTDVPNVQNNVQNNVHNKVYVILCSEGERSIPLDVYFQKANALAKVEKFVTDHNETYIFNDDNEWNYDDYHISIEEYLVCDLPTLTKKAF